MKTPDEIKQGLEECGYKYGSCGLCPYDRPGSGVTCMAEMKQDALAYIRQLEQERESLLNIAWQCGCETCKHVDKGTNEEPCCLCVYCDGEHEKWEWSGTKEVQKV